jgi:N-methylhydantoinase A
VAADSPPDVTDGLRIGVDIGGTFTDIIAFDPAAGRYETAKAPSTPGSPAAGVVDALEAFFADTRYDPDEVAVISHGSTVSINAVIERTGARTGLLLTEGYDAIPVARRGDRPHAEVKNPRYAPPDPLVPHRLVREVPERVDADGSVRRPLDEPATREAVRAFRDAGVESIAICLLFAFRNPDHERRVAEIVREEHPDCAVSCSADVVPRIREYPRLSTTTLNAYVDPLLGAYLDELETELESLGVEPPERSMMLSHGGLDSFDRAAAVPVQTLMSGPAAGVAGARFVADLVGLSDFVTMDMGGTSCDIAIATDGQPLTTSEKAFDRNPVSVPMLDIEAIGAGGGTIARVSGGRLRVGPDSAGADPGPVCYGRGGDQVTVTDANVILGRLNPEALLGGDLELDVAGAHRAVEANIAEPLNLSVTAAAAGIVRVVNDKMKKELSLALARRGFDPREFALVTYGGAGPMHAPAVARELSLESVVVPPWPGINSAVGLLAGDRRRLYQQSRVDRLPDAPLDAVFGGLEDEARGDAAGRGEEAALAVERELELRYAGQSYELLVPVEPGEPPDAIRERFDDQHREAYGHVSDEPVETMTYRLTARPASPSLTGDLLERPGSGYGGGYPVAHRAVYF